jgi:hypothetical protein
MLVLSHMRPSTWKIDAVAPALPPDKAFFLDFSKICLAVKVGFLTGMVALSATSALALDGSGLEVIIAADAETTTAVTKDRREVSLFDPSVAIDSGKRRRLTFAFPQGAFSSLFSSLHDDKEYAR